MEISGKIALVTGAASGIGRATAIALSGEGASVAVCDIDSEGGTETVSAIAAQGGQASFFEGDVSTPSGVRSLFAAVEAAYGGIDIVHNNAGIMTGDTPGWPEVGLEKIKLVISVNVAGVMMGTGAAIQALRKRGGGAIVNTASVAALGPMPNDPMYAASKAAVVNFTESCAVLAESENIRVNAVLPGMVDTPIIGKTGDGVNPAAWLRPAIAATTFLQPEEIADVVLGLIRDDSKAGSAELVVPPDNS
ncbi:MAG: short chain dehydrogenase [Dehalococcoidia bacterium]|nr:short chain dehydrogenase [Dehalococcoidia bacterium]HCV00254.1 short chain dehydrogenase [Dehalococcoidia bacterium]